MKKNEKAERLDEIKKLAHAFCIEYLNHELTKYVMELCDRIGRKQTISITRGRPEIWAGSIVYVIARLNFLFDKDSPYFLTPDRICEFFGTNKSTTGNKATQIEKICNIRMGEKGLCHPSITDMLTYVETPEGFIVPLSMFSKVDLRNLFLTDEEIKALEIRRTEERIRKEREAEERKAQQAEMKRKLREQKWKEKHKNQIDMFGNDR